MRALPRGPLARALALGAVLIALIAVVRAVYVDPRVRESKALKTKEGRLRAELADLERGEGEIRTWSLERPGGATPARRALPARAMVSGFLKAIGPLAAKHGISTESIEPVRPPEEIEAGGPGQGPVMVRKVALRFRVAGAYRDLAEYVLDVERMDQAVLVRSVTIQFDPARYPRLESEIVFWLYGSS